MDDTAKLEALRRRYLTHPHARAHALVRYQARREACHVSEDVTDAIRHLAHRLSRSGSTSQIPVAILSSKRAPEGTQESRDAGATDYRVKPFSPEEVVACCKQIPEAA